jgi:aryl-alcohol dehydrogenase-like predicted oxidoreductase
MRDLENTFSCMKAAYDVSINFFDCAEGYSNSESEPQSRPGFQEIWMEMK